MRWTGVQGAGAWETEEKEEALILWEHECSCRVALLCSDKVTEQVDTGSLRRAPNPG